jgi:hypothetical protein
MAGVDEMKRRRSRRIGIRARLLSRSQQEARRTRLSY